MIEQNDVNHAHNDRISKMAQFEELTRELQDYAYCLGYNRCMDQNDALRAENAILREALERIDDMRLLNERTAGDMQEIARQALQWAGGDK